MTVFPSYTDAVMISPAELIPEFLGFRHPLAKLYFKVNFNMPLQIEESIKKLNMTLLRDFGLDKKKSLENKGVKSV